MSEGERVTGMLSGWRRYLLLSWNLLIGVPLIAGAVFISDAGLRAVTPMMPGEISLPFADRFGGDRSPTILLCEPIGLAEARGTGDENAAAYYQMRMVQVNEELARSRDLGSLVRLQFPDSNLALIIPSMPDSYQGAGELADYEVNGEVWRESNNVRIAPVWRGYRQDEPLACPAGTGWLGTVIQRGRE